METVKRVSRLKKEVRRQCSLSPYLFNLYAEAINGVRKEIQVGIKVHCEKMLRFAHDKYYANNE